MKPAEQSQAAHELMLKLAIAFSLLIALAWSASPQVATPSSTPPQGNDNAKKPACIHAGSLTQANSKGGDRGAWTNNTSSQDGLLSLTYCGVFKGGPTVVHRIINNELAQIPTGFEPLVKHAEVVGEKLQVRRLPLGFSVYKNMAFEIRTEAIPGETYLTFRLPSVQTEEEFNNLAILYLDEDQMLPGTLQWDASYSEMDIPKSDFKTRTLTSVFDFATAFDTSIYTGRVIVAAFNQAEYNKSSIDLCVQSVIGPPHVKVGETFTYEITVSHCGGYSIPATEVVFNSNVSGATIVSASSSQGRCRQSVNTIDKVVCEFGTIQPFSNAVVRITIKAKEQLMMDRNEEVFSTINSISCREADSLLENNIYQSRSTLIRR